MNFETILMRENFKATRWLEIEKEMGAKQFQSLLKLKKFHQKSPSNNR
jgi:hypothetical protein